MTDNIAMTLGLLNPTLKVDKKAALSLGRAFWNLMHLWKISPKDQALLLGVKFHSTKLKDWEDKQLIPEDPDKFRRVGNLAGIHKNLKILFPYNRRAAYEFMQTPQQFLFEGKSPIEIIREGGEILSYANLAAIRRRLDQARV